MSNVGALETASSGDWERSLKKNTPPAVIDHIRQSADIDYSSIEIESSGLSGLTEAVKVMTASDMVFGMSRGAYEMVQGMTDFGWLNHHADGWQPPSINYTDELGITNKYTGTETFTNASQLDFVNAGSLNRQNVLLFGNANQDFTDSGGKLRDGGYGQGMKIFIAMAVSNYADRAVVLERFANDPKATIVESDREKIKSVARSLNELHKTLDDSDQLTNFVTIESADQEGPYRIYAYRKPIFMDKVWIWKIEFVICRLQPSTNHQQTVKISIHNPDPLLKRAVADAPHNILLCNPKWSGDTSLVRSKDDTRPVGEMETFDSNHLSIDAEKLNYGRVHVQKMTGVHEPPALFFRGTRLKPLNSFDLKLYSWNIEIDTDDPDAIQVINRTSNSMFVSGPVAELIEAAMEINPSKSDWVAIFTEFSGKSLEEASMIQNRYPEFAVTRQHSGYPKYPLTPFREAWLEVFPHSGKFFAETEKARQLFDQLPEKYRLENPNFHQSPIRDQNNHDQPRPITSAGIPILHGVKKCLTTAGLVSLDEHVTTVIAGPTRVSRDDSIFCASLNDHQIPQAETEPSASSAIEVIKAYLLQPEGLDFLRNGITYDVSGTELFFSLNGYNMRNLMKDFISSISSDSQGTSTNFGLLTTQFLTAMDTLGFQVELSYGTEWRSQLATFSNFPGSGSFLVVGKPLFYHNYSAERLIIRPKSDAKALVELLKELDKTLGAMKPSLLENRTPETPEEKLTRIAIETNSKAETLRALEGAIDELIDGGDEDGLVNAVVDRDELNGSPLSDMFEDFFGFARGTTILENKIYPSADHYRSLSPEQAERREKAKPKKDHFTVSWYGINPPDYYPLEAQNHIGFDESKGIFMNSTNSNYEYAGKRDSKSIWRSYEPNSGSASYLQRSIDTFTNECNYDGMVELNSNMRIGHNREVILPIDAKNYTVAFIQIPLEKGKKVGLPSLFFDNLNQQYIVRCKDETDDTALDALPAGTRIYVREKKDNATETDEQLLRRQFPHYYESLSQHLLKIESLDPGMRNLVLLLKQNTLLSRLTKQEVIHAAWKKRQLYDTNTEVASIEDLIANGKGVCRHSAIAELDLLRAAGVPCRLRSAYPDNYRTGRLCPPYHAMIEFLNDEGKWQTFDPPNSRFSEELAEKINEDRKDGRKPVLFEAPSLLRDSTASSSKFDNSIEVALEQINKTQEGKIDPTIVIDSVKMLTNAPASVIDKHHQTVALVKEALKEVDFSRLPTVTAMDIEAAIDEIVSALAQTTARDIAGLRHLANQGVPPETLEQLAGGLGTDLASVLAQAFVTSLLRNGGQYHASEKVVEWTPPVRFLTWRDFLQAKDLFAAELKQASEFLEAEQVHSFNSFTLIYVLNTITEEKFFHASMVGVQAIQYLIMETYFSVFKEFRLNSTEALKQYQQDHQLIEQFLNRLQII